jgi:hypothetical protein
MSRNCNLSVFRNFDIVCSYRCVATVPALIRLPVVPRYFFHFSDGKRRFSDATGHVLPGIAAARIHAVKQVRELKAAMCDPGIQDLSGWTMTVADADDNIVFETGFALKVARAES